MSQLVGCSPWAYLAITIVLLGFAAYMTGQALAATWRPVWQLFVYTALLGLASRFLIYALAEGPLLLWTGYLIDVGVLLIIISFAYRLTRARTMLRQYPWLYEPSGLLGWRARH
jgi:hypothetical protein